MPLISSLGVMNAINFGLASSVAPYSPNDIALGLSSASGSKVIAYKWSGGFSTKYSNPSSYATSNYEVAFSKNNKYLVTGGTAGQIYKYGWSSLGFGTSGTIYTGNSTDINSIDFNNATSAVICGLSASPFIKGYQFPSGTAYSNPSTLPDNYLYSIRINKQDTAVAMAGYFSQRIMCYSWTNASGFGTKYADPSTLPSGGSTTARFNNAGTVAMFGSNFSNYLFSYPWSNGFGTKYADPSTLPTSSVLSLCFNKQDNTVAIGYAASPYINVYPWSNGFGTKYSDPSTLPVAFVADVVFNKTGNAVICSINSISTSSLIAYNWSDGFGSQFANPSTVPTGTQPKLSFSN